MIYLIISADLNVNYFSILSILYDEVRRLA